MKFYNFAYNLALIIMKGVQAKVIKLNLHEAKNAIIGPEINELIAPTIIPIQLEVNPYKRKVDNDKF